MPDSVRLALGTFTILRVPPPRVVDRGTARGAMLLAPLIGALLAVVGAVVILAVRLSPLGHRTHRRTQTSPPRATAGSIASTPPH